MGFLIKFETKDSLRWDSLAPYKGYRIVKKPFGRGAYVYHGYRDDSYVAYGKTLEQAISEVSLYHKRKS